ncbi:hypothetical protein L195_g022039 [Trifolium pratense]|uniref:CCHC-type domain-containing protein n=1 Tax=Trifolium pratense TaxID=57577 RepID=A0A2K3N6X6_TRIPR|nr:hypothetical protein L195_g022039 [Trifolium pratense]
MRTRENPISFEELHDVLTDFETFNKRDEEPSHIASAHAAYRNKHSAPRHNYPYNQAKPTFNPPPSSAGTYKRVTCQYCDRPGHIAKICRKMQRDYAKPSRSASAHSAINSSPVTDNDWILDSGATHHITNALEDLHFTTPYHGADKITVGDGNTLPITHTGLEDKGASSKRIA